jgi:multidrug efflux system membrane fusion protein
MSRTRRPTVPPSSSDHRPSLALGGALAVLGIVLLLPGCGRSEAQGGGPPMGPPVSVAPAVERSVQASDEFTGRLEATETVDVRPRVGGTLEAVHFKAGDEVKRGQLLFRIDARPYEAELARAQAQLAAARTSADLAASEQARAQKLVAQRAISQQEADQLSSGARNSLSSVKAAEAAVAVAKLNVDYSQIRSPLTGRASRNNISPGNLVAAGDPVLTTVVSQDKVYAYFDVSEQVYLRLAPALASKKRPVVAMGLSSEAGFPHQGAIDFFDNRLNPATASVRARAVFDNTGQAFTPGLFARLRLASGESLPAVLTPERAIGTDQSKRFVWVLGGDKMPQFREVKLGALEEGGMRVVTSGLKAGELVVVNGLQRVRPGAPLNAQVLAVDDKGLPITPPPAPPGAASGAAPAASGAASAAAKKG